MNVVIIEVIGVDPPCKRCATTQKNAEEAAKRLRELGIEVDVKKLNIVSKDVISKYGVILSPALAINDQIRVAGRIPNPEEIIGIIKESISVSPKKK